jgi:hypothetical protein
VHPVRPRARRRAVAQRTNVTIAPMGARGPLRNRIPGSIERRQALLLDGIRMSIEMAQIGYRRLESAARRRQAVERVGGIARRVGTCGHAEPTTGADQPHDLRARRVHQTGDGDREFNVDVANGGTLIGALCVAIGGLRPASHDDAMTCARHADAFQGLHGSVSEPETGNARAAPYRSRDLIAPAGLPPDRASGRGVGTAILAGQLLGPRQHGRSRREAEASSVSETAAGAATSAVVRHRVTTRSLVCWTARTVCARVALLCKPYLGDRNDKQRALRRWR